MLCLLLLLPRLFSSRSAWRRWKWCRTCGRTSDSTTRHWKLAFCWHFTETKLISAHVPSCRDTRDAETLAHSTSRHGCVVCFLFFRSFLLHTLNDWNSVYTKQTRDIYYFIFFWWIERRADAQFQFNSMLNFPFRSKCQRKFKKICSIRVATSDDVYWESVHLCARRAHEDSGRRMAKHRKNSFD